MFLPSDFISLFFSYCLTLSLIVLLRSLQFCPDASYIWSHFPQSIAYATIRMDFLKHDSICFIHLLKINQRLFVQDRIQTHIYHTWKTILKHSSSCVCYHKVCNKTIGAICFHIPKMRRCTLYVELVRGWQNLFCNPQPTSYSQPRLQRFQRALASTLPPHPDIQGEHACTRTPKNWVGKGCSPLSIEAQ